MTKLWKNFLVLFSLALITESFLHCKRYLKSLNPSWTISWCLQQRLHLHISNNIILIYHYRSAASADPLLLQRYLHHGFILIPESLVQVACTNAGGPELAGWHDIVFGLLVNDKVEDCVVDPSLMASNNAKGNQRWQQ